MSEQGSGGEERLVFGVPAEAVVDALRGTGMAEADVIAVVGRGITRSAGEDTVTVAATAPFVFQTHVAQIAPECRLDFERGFFHPDFVDGVTVVQAGTTAEEIGFNRRFHTIETDLDEIATNLRTASNCMAQLRLELFGVVQELQTKITEIEARLDAKTKDKDKDSKEKDKEKEKDSKEKDKEGKDSKEKDKDFKEKDKDFKEKDSKEKEGEKDGSKEFAEFVPVTDPTASSTARGGDEGTERTFISLTDRPEVGRAALADPAEER